MADFCNQCAATLGFDHGDLDGITKPEDWEKGLAAVVLCEGCGAIQVDPQGNCISADCYENHGCKQKTQTEE
jgi:hypothetical protein